MFARRHRYLLVAQWRFKTTMHKTSYMADALEGSLKAMMATFLPGCVYDLNTMCQPYIIEAPQDAQNERFW